MNYIRKNYFLIFFILLIVLSLVSLAIGRIEIPFTNIFMILMENFFKLEISPMEEKIVELVRFPRVVMAVVVGMSLSVSGATLQGVFRNPLASPNIIGVSSGAAFGGALGIMLFNSALGIIILAFVSGLLSIVLISIISRTDGQNPILLVVLSGVVVGALFSALVSLLTYIADPEDKLPAIVYWLLGSFVGADFNKLYMLLISSVFGMILLYLLRYKINILSLGEEDAKTLGIDVEKTKWLILSIVALIISSCVAVSGIVGWVGLVVPHFARMLVGADHKKLIPASALIGGIYLLFIDNVARSVSENEIPIGILTAILGAPIFIILLRKIKNKGWNNA